MAIKKERRGLGWKLIIPGCPGGRGGILEGGTGIALLSEGSFFTSVSFSSLISFLILRSLDRDLNSAN